MKRASLVPGSRGSFLTSGGWYAVLRVPVTRSDEEVAVTLLEAESVLVHPGHFYDFQSEGFLVLSLIASEDVYCEGLGRVLRFMSEICSQS